MKEPSRRLGITDRRLSVATWRGRRRPLPIPTPSVTSIPLRTTSEWRRPTGPPSLVHGWHDRLGPPWPSWPPTASNDAAKDGEQDETANGGADANDEVLVIGYPTADLLDSGGAFADTLRAKMSQYTE